MRMQGRALLTMAALVAVAACGPAGPQLDAHQVLQAAATSTAALKSVQLDLKFGPGFQVQGVELVSATGKFRAPSDSDLVAKTRAAEGFIEPELLTVGDKIYVKFIQLQAFQELTPAQGQQYPVIARLLDRTNGLAPAIARGRNSSLAGSEKIDGVDCDKVDATYGPNELNKALAPLHLAGDVHAVLWVGKSDHFVRKIRFDGPLFTAGQNTFAEVHLHDFNAPVDIPSPG